MSVLEVDAQTATFITALGQRCQARILEYRHRQVDFADFKDDFFTTYIANGLDLIVIESCTFSESGRYPAPTVANDPIAIQEYLSLHTLEDIATRYNLFVVRTD